MPVDRSKPVCTLARLHTLLQVHWRAATERQSTCSRAGGRSGAGRTPMPRERIAGNHHDQGDAGMAEPAGGRWLTIHEACAFLGVDQSTLRRWSDTGKVPVFRTPGGHRRYAEADLRALVGDGPRLQERPRVSRQTLTDRSLSGYEDDY